MRIGNREFDTENGVYVMGILNVTPDSFSDGGRWLERGRGAPSGGQNGRRGRCHHRHRRRVHPPRPQAVGARGGGRARAAVIAAVKRETGLPVSVDTYRHETARLALEAGADMVNDIWGLRYDGGEMARLIAQSGAACCLMHNRKSAEYSDFMPELLEGLRGTLDLAAAAGIARERIILDPGIGFAKSCEQNLTAMHRLDELAALGCPVLLAASRKSVIGLSLGLPVEERLEGTLATTAIGVLRGAAFVRVHDVKENLRAARMALAIRREARPVKGLDEIRIDGLEALCEPRRLPRGNAAGAEIPRLDAAVPQHAAGGARRRAGSLGTLRRGLRIRDGLSEGAHLETHRGRGRSRQRGRAAALAAHRGAEL